MPNIPLNDVIVDAAARPRLYVASDAGVLYSTDNGTNWYVLGTGLPTVPVHDLALHSPTRKLVAFTHGRSAWTADLSTLTNITEPTASLPTTIDLQQNYPNPFNPATKIRFTLLGSGYTTLKVFDALGKEVATLAAERMESGEYERTFDAMNIPSGVYFYRLQIGSVSQTKRLVVLK